MPESYSRHIKDSHQKKLSPYFFDELIYPAHWKDMADHILLDEYKYHLEKQPMDTTSQLVICFLLKRHKGGIILVSRKYIKHEEQLIEFTHDLFIKLIKILQKVSIKSSFCGFLLTTVKNMHQDALRKNKPKVDIETLHSKPHPHNLENQIGQELDFPLSDEKLKVLKNKGILSVREYECIKLALIGYKPREIASEIDEAILDMIEIKTLKDPEDRFSSKLKKIHGALERARKKIKRHFGKNY